MLKEKYNVLSLFSGAMGLDIGLHSTGRFSTVACIEKQKPFCETIRINKVKGHLPEDLMVIDGDISKMDPKDILEKIKIKKEDIDIIIGGPPCQSFSTAGKRGTVQDPRGTLIWDYLRFVEYIQPKFFLLENVRGLLSAALKHRPIRQRPEKGGAPLEPDEEPGSVIRLFAKDLSELHGASYHLDIFEVNAVNYGAPQIRERVLIFGNRYDIHIDFPQPTHCRPEMLRGQIELFNLSLSPWKTLGDALYDLNDTNQEVLDFSPRKKQYLDLVPPGSNWRSLPIDIQKESMGEAWHAKGGRSGWWRRLSFDLPSPTIMTLPNHASTSLCHPIETRALSVREYARIQEFPDDWEFCGTLSEKYTQIGNAVPTRLGKISGDVVIKYLDMIEAEKLEPKSSSDSVPTVKYIQSHVRTRQWYKNGEAVIWNDGEENPDASYSIPKTKNKVRSL